MCVARERITSILRRLPTGYIRPLAVTDYPLGTCAHLRFHLVNEDFMLHVVLGQRAHAQHEPTATKLGLGSGWSVRLRFSIRVIIVWTTALLETPLALNSITTAALVLNR